MRQSKIIDSGQLALKHWAEQHGGQVYIFGGDDVSFFVPRSEEHRIEEARQLYHKLTGYTATVGVGDTISHAAHAMVYGKLHGKNQLNRWTPEIEVALKDLQHKVNLSPEEKMRQEGLIKTYRKIAGVYTLMKIGEQYKNIARSHVNLLYPVSIGGRHRLVDEIPLHVSVKIFGEGGQIQPEEVFRRLQPYEQSLKQPIDASKLRIVPYKFTGRTGELHHVLLLNGMPDHLSQIYHANRDIGFNYPQFLPHVTVDKAIWDKVNEGHLQPKDVGLEIHPPELRVGNQVLKAY